MRRRPCSFSLLKLPYPPLPSPMIPSRGSFSPSLTLPPSLVTRHSSLVARCSFAIIQPLSASRSLTHALVLSRSLLVPLLLLALLLLFLFLVPSSWFLVLLPFPALSQTQYPRFSLHLFLYHRLRQSLVLGSASLLLVCCSQFPLLLPARLFYFLFFILVSIKTLLPPRLDLMHHRLPRA
ncbi:hypothetical protein BKA56DRAFT_70827 [Ilyonectria sp. MPI-CAGE-AT-0026]|nr:hypothetical protein BKA56DRAFT_70827 [Ilyonectria sp. MPI-CAGE-AT-0026]